MEIQSFRLKASGNFLLELLIYRSERCGRMLLKAATWVYSSIIRRFTTAVNLKARYSVRGTICVNGSRSGTPATKSQTKWIPPPRPKCSLDSLCWPTVIAKLACSCVRSELEGCGAQTSELQEG